MIEFVLQPAQQEARSLAMIDEALPRHHAYRVLDGQVGVTDWGPVGLYSTHKKSAAFARSGVIRSMVTSTGCYAP